MSCSILPSIDLISIPKPKIKWFQCCLIADYPLIGLILQSQGPKKASKPDPKDKIFVDQWTMSFPPLGILLSTWSMIRTIMSWIFYPSTSFSTPCKTSGMHVELECWMAFFTCKCKVREALLESWDIPYLGYLIKSLIFFFGLPNPDIFRCKRDNNHLSNVMFEVWLDPSPLPVIRGRPFNFWTS